MIETARNEQGARTDGRLPAGRWVIDTAFSNVGYEVKHMGVVPSRGWFREFEGVIDVGADEIRASGTVAVASLQTGDWARDEHVRGRLFLAYEDFPEMRFESTRVDRRGLRDITVAGLLSLHGVTREIELAGFIEGLELTPHGRPRMGLSLSTHISRRDFNLRFNRLLGSGAPVVGDRIQLVLELTAVLADENATPPRVERHRHGDVLVARVSNPFFGDANTYLVANTSSRAAVLVDAGGPVAGLLELVDELGLRLSHVLLTHHHLDHVAELDVVLARDPGLPVLIAAPEAWRVPQATGTLPRGGQLSVDGLKVVVISTPGHTDGGVSFLVDDEVVFTGDTLYRDTISTVEMTGHSSFADLRHGLEQLLALPADTHVYSGHGDPTTIGRELDLNPFARVLTGAEPEGEERCMALGREARIIVLGSDGHGDERAWIRWRDGGGDDVVPGLVLERGGDG